MNYALYSAYALSPENSVQMLNSEVPLQSIKYSICIVTLDRPSQLNKCLNSLAVALNQLESDSFEVIVSDDSICASSFDVVSAYKFSRWIKGPSRGVAANRNNVAKNANGKWIIFIDDDELAHEDWLLHYKIAIAEEKWDVIEGRVQPIDFPDNILWYAPTISTGGAYCTANLAIKRESFCQLGGFDERYSVSHEDVELGNRIRSFGLKSLYLNDAIVFHPARRYTFAHVWNRLISLQCQSYMYQQQSFHDSIAAKPVNLLSYCAKYWFRVTRFELAARYKNHWLRPLQASFLLMFSSSLAFLKLLFKSKSNPYI